VATREDAPTNGNFAKWNGALNRFDTAAIQQSDIQNRIWSNSGTIDYLTTTTNKVGIGTTNPLTKLQIKGLDNYPTAGVAGGGLSITASSNTYGLFIGAEYTSGNSWLQAQRNDGNTALYSLLLNPIGGNVGIGTTSPATKTHIELPTAGGDAEIINNATLLIGGNASNGALAFGINGTGTFHSWIQSMHKVVNSTYFDLAINPNGGNVGIGTTSPLTKLQISSNNLTSPIASGASGQSIGVIAGTRGLVGDNLSNGNFYLQVQRIDGTATNYNLILQPNGGNVGIGTVSTTSKFSISGLQLNASGLATGDVYYDSNGFLKIVI